MDLTETGEQRLLRDAAERFAADVGAGQGPADPWAEMGRLGWLGLPLPEAHGGAGAGMAEVATLMRALGRHRVTLPYASAVVLCGGLVAALGDTAQQAALLRPLATGELLLALGVLEPGGGDEALRPRTTAWRQGARHQGAGWRLEGAKTLALGAPQAAVLLVTAAVEDGNIGVFLVPRDAPGLALRPRETVLGLASAELRLDDVLLPATALLGGATDAAAALEAALDRAAAALCADAAGTMAWLLETTTAYVKQRVQFGQPLARFQVVQHRLAEMAVHCEEADAMALLAALRAEAAPPRRIRAVAGAKAKIGRAARQVAQQAVQLHGGMGVTEELPVGGAFKRLMGFEASFGTTATQARRYAALIGAEAALDGLAGDAA